MIDLHEYLTMGVSWVHPRWTGVKILTSFYRIEFLLSGPEMKFLKGLLVYVVRKTVRF